MDINRLGGAYQQYVKNESLKNEKVGKNHNSNRIINQDTAPVKLSVDGSSKKYIEMAKNEIPDIRENLVEEMKEAIDQGLYKIDADKIAEKLLGGF
ncbi:flagellar biosynthesis anti-sigma factor FlgM [Marinitoga piezophila KA3]|uniref:Negative regulator of flagellin synthesis n=1 Tax=Marinitoga piezophila (strain DSM 14283 / JCM 11233 / KA3) TaxID=443254 RepID=H2J5V7_MARPK|nr:MULTISPECIES: flagellar biosynthesis anti-sigma factor FlgM [Marinitoga]AEX86176.1 flagellar biosynthesis anti-sigma factor FlgM [Marinitoga piezophila KA3]